ncbi:MAG: sensor histidine kinase, partial [Blastocatellia bacterium]|nr:sensor histidine kinase [Blastocatellia bacterium]
VTLKTKPEVVETRLNEAEKLVRQVQAELVDLIRELRPQDEDDLCEKVENYLQTWSRQNGISADCFLGKDMKLPQTVENTLFRIIQEALANIAKHSRADKVEIELAQEKQNFQLTISDNGIGFDGQKRSDGIGLKTMRERAESLKNGSLEIETEDGKGVKIKISFEI